MSYNRESVSDGEALSQLVDQIVHSLEMRHVFGITSMELFLTDSCNMDCSYCFERCRNTSRLMPLEMGKGAIAWFLSQRPVPIRRDILFFGGEPMLRSDDMFAMAEFARAAQPSPDRLGISVTTNGTILPDSAIDRFLETEMSVLISIDPGKKAHNEHRRFRNGKPTYDIVWRSLGKLARSGVRSSVRPTLYPGLLGDLEDFVCACVDIGATEIVLGPVYGVPWDSESLERLEEALTAVGRIYYKWLKEGRRIRIPTFDRYVAPSDGPRRGCSAGRSLVAIAPEGDLFGCAKCLTANGGKGIHCLGSISSWAIDQEQKQLLANCGTKQLEKCKSCTISHFCSGSCPAANHDSVGTSQEPPLAHCQIQHIFYRIAQSLF